MTYTDLAKLPSPRILMLESLGAVDTHPAATSEKEMYQNLEKLLSTSKGRVIIGTFSSQIRRIGHIIEYAEKIGKKVALDGYSMKMNVEIAKELGYIKAHKETLIPISDIHKYPENRVIVICTGAQGEGNAVLSRIITDQHRFVKIQKDDTVIFSSSVIPGNERTVQRLKDNLYRKCDNVIHSDMMDVHTSGHCKRRRHQKYSAANQAGFFSAGLRQSLYAQRSGETGTRNRISQRKYFCFGQRNANRICKKEKPKFCRKKWIPAM